MSGALGRDLATRPIGVFDSGIGGLTVVRALRQRLPNEDIVYFGDTARVPYGTKSAETVVRFSRECFNFLVRRDIKLLVVACNTASAIALPELRASLRLPMLGVIEPGVAAALAVTRTRTVGVVGTAATTASGAYDRCLRASDPGITVVQSACPLFVPLAEEGWVVGEVPRLVARQYLAPLIAAGIDTLILGCTHYPMLRGVIADVLGPTILLVDSAEETAAATAGLLERLGLARTEPGGTCRVFVTDSAQRFTTVGGAFLGGRLDAVTVVDQSDLPWYER
jgi:glutamate racemase